MGMNREGKLGRSLLVVRRRDPQHAGSAPRFQKTDSYASGGLLARASLFLSEQISRFAKQVILEIGYDVPQWTGAARTQARLH